MSTTGRTVAKNASVLMISQVLTWGMAIALTIFLPRILGAEGIGQIALADALWIIVGIFFAFGMDTYLTKEISRLPQRTGELLGISIVLRTALFVVGFVAVVVYTSVVGYAQVTVIVIFIYGFGRLITEFGNATTAALVGLERMEYMALANVVTRAFATIVTIAVLLLGYGVIAVAVVFVASSIVGFLVQLFYLNRIQPLHFSFSIDIARIMLRASVPYLFVTVFSVMYMNVDAVIISLIVDEETLGWYAGADRLLGTLMFIPVVFLTALFPALSRLHTESPEALRNLMRRSFDMLLIMGVPIGIGLFCIANNLVVLLYGDEFAPSGPVLAIMGLTLVFTYQNILLNRFLIAVDRQSLWAVVMAVAVAATIPLDLILIPWTQATFGNGAIGGALSYVFTEVGMLVVGLRYLPAGSLNRGNAWVAVRVLTAGAIMAAVVWPLRHLFVAIPIAAGAFTYVIMILLLRVISNEDKLLLKGQAKRIWRRTLGRRSQPVGMDS